MVTEHSHIDSINGNTLGSGRPQTTMSDAHTRQRECKKCVGYPKARWYPTHSLHSLVSGRFLTLQPA